MSKRERTANRDSSQPLTVANLGCGPRGGGRLPRYFESWRQLRVDVDPGVEPDIVSDLTDLSQIPDGSVDAIWAAHCVEHLYEHEVVKALLEFYRILGDDGFACIAVPDLQTVARYIVSDKLHEPIYQSAAGPVTPHDVFFGYGPAIAAGRTSMAHRCGFTPSLLLKRFGETPFTEAVVRRRPSLELVVVANKRISRSTDERNALITALEL